MEKSQLSTNLNTTHEVHILMHLPEQRLNLKLHRKIRNQMPVNVMDLLVELHRDQLGNQTDVVSDPCVKSVYENTVLSLTTAMDEKFALTTFKDSNTHL
jgi:hypothetical protein